MSVIISQTYRPAQNTMYAKNTVPKLLVEATENISVQLRYWSWSDRENAQWGEADIVFSGSYAPDFLGEIWLDYGDLYGAYLNTVMPGSATTIVQSANIGYFHLFVADSAGNVIQDSALKWYVFNGMLNASLPFETWSQQNFLTNQPLEKPTTYDSREWLTYLDLDSDWNIIGRFYPKEGGMVDCIVRSDTAEGCFSVDVSYARLIPMVARLPHQLKGYYDIIMMDGNLTEICRQRYIYRERSGKEHYFLFVNALGGIDTMICDGENVLQPETTYNIGRFGKQFIPIDDTDDNRQWTQETGMVPYRWRNWMHELLTAKRDAAFYNQQDQSMNPIVITESSIAMGDNGQLASASFAYKMTDVDNVMADTERALDRSLHQSVADEAEEMADMTKTAVLSFSDDGQGGYETSVLNIEATSFFIIFEKSASSKNVYLYLDGKERGIFNPFIDTSPISVPFGPKQTLQLKTSVSGQEPITIKYYGQNLEA